MANARYYSSVAAVTNLQTTAGPGDATVQVASSAGFPNSFPYELTLDYGSANAEIVLVTAGGPSVFNVTRAYDGTSATTHNAGAVVRHTSSAIDFTDSRTHEASSSGVHGITGAFVDTLSVQTLQNKTLSAPVVNNGTVTGSVTATGATVSNGTFSTPTINNPTVISGGTLGGTFSGAPTFSGGPSFSNGLNVSGSWVSIKRTATSNNAATAGVTGESNDRFALLADGTTSWGSGSASQDVSLFRSSASTLTLSGNLTTTGTLGVNGNMTVGGTFTPVTIAGNPAFTGHPTFAPTTISGSSLIPDTVANGWSLDAAAGRTAGGVTTVRIMVERVGSNIVATSSGNIPDTKIGTLAAGWRPLDGTMITNYDMSGIATGSASIGNDGIITIKSLMAGNTIGLADTVTFSLTFVSSI